MNTTREIAIQRVAKALGKPARWASTTRLAGGYDGSGRTLELFLADAGEQLGLLRQLRPLDSELEEAVGGPVVVVFHTRAETVRLYPDVLGGGALRGMRIDARGKECAVRTEPFPTDDATPVRFIHGSVESLRAGAIK